MEIVYLHRFIMLGVFFVASSVLANTRILMNVEEKQGKIEFRIPTLKVLGFVNEPKNIKDRRKLFELIAFFESGIAKIITFDKAIECIITKELIGLTNDAYDKAANVNQDKKIKSEFSASFQIDCKKDLIGTQVIVDLTPKKKIKELSFTIQIGESINKKFNSKNKVTTFELN